MAISVSINIFTKTSDGLDLTHKPYFFNPCNRKYNQARSLFFEKIKENKRKKTQTLSKTVKRKRGDKLSIQEMKKGHHYRSHRY